MSSPRDDLASYRPELDRLEVAYLAGGAKRATDAAITSLVHVGALAVRASPPHRSSPSAAAVSRRPGPGSAESLGDRFHPVFADYARSRLMPSAGHDADGTEFARYLRQRRLLCDDGRLVRYLRPGAMDDCQVASFLSPPGGFFTSFACPRKVESIRLREAEASDTP